MELQVDLTVVCEKMFLSIFGISQKKKRSAVQHFIDNDYMSTSNARFNISKGAQKVFYFLGTLVHSLT